MNFWLRCIYIKHCKNMIMNPNLLISIILPIFWSCNASVKQPPVESSVMSAESHSNPYRYVKEIPVPAGFVRTEAKGFGSWLRNRPLKIDNYVYLYNGQLKSNQSAQFAVLDIPIGKKDLQQCADAVMRLRAEYLFEKGNYDQIVFHDNAHKAYTFTAPFTRDHLEKYLETVYSHCGTLSLATEMDPVHDPSDPQIGDVFIHGGSPGHAAIILDRVENAAGEKMVLIANGYMPAQSIHIVRNIHDQAMSPWIKIDGQSDIALPEWRFGAREIKRF